MTEVDELVGEWSVGRWVGGWVESSRWGGGSVVGGFNNTHIN